MDISTIQVDQLGAITLPRSLQEKYAIKIGDSFQLVDLDGMFVFISMTPTVTELAQEIEAIRKDAGVGITELLQGLREQRTQY